MNTQRALIVRETCLDDVADDDIHVAEVVNPDGSMAFWLLGFEGEPQSLTRIPEHEQVGPLPWTVLRRLEALPEVGRCNAPTKAGTPCRKSATGCPFHRVGTLDPSGATE